MDLKERLNELMTMGNPIGFSPWRDAKGTLWGVLLSVGEDQFTVHLIGSLGEDDGEKTIRLSQVSFVHEEAGYSERLRRLQSFQATKTTDDRFDKSRPVVRDTLISAVSTGEVIHVLLRDEYSSRTVKVSWCDGTWAEFVIYEDLMDIRERMVWRVSAVRAVRSGTAREEADEFLLAMRS